MVAKLQCGIALLLAAAGADALAADPVFELPKRAQAADVAPAAVARQVRFHGNTVLPTSELDRVAAPFLARPLDQAAREQLRIAVTEHYVAAGYVNSGAVLGAQEGDVLTMEIVEGRLSAMRVLGMNGLRDEYLLERLAGEPGAPFNMEQLRARFALVLSDPLFERLNARLMPGAKPGEAILDVDVTRARPYEVSAYVNNYRPPSIGANAIGLKGVIRNLTGWGDALELGVQGAVSGERSPRSSLAWSMPVSRATSLTLQWEHGQSSVIEEPLRVLDIESVLDSKEIGVRHVLHESLARKFAIGLAAGERTNRTTLAGEPFSFTPGEPDGETRVRALRFWQEAVLRAPRQVLALRSTFSATRNNTQEIAGLPPGGAPQPARRALLWQGQGQFARQLLPIGAQLVVRASVQWTGRTLVALDRVAIGGVGTVRGYRENQLIRDRSAVLNVEFDYPLAVKGMTWSLVPFIDAGHGSNVGESGTSIASAGLATRLRWKGLALDLAFGKALQRPAALGPRGHGSQDHGVHAQLSYRFL